MKKVLLVLGVLAIALWALPVYAITYLVTPSSITIPDVKVFRNLAETGDELIVFQYNIEIPSDNFSTTLASDSFIFRLYDTDNTTLRCTSNPYVFPFWESNGYGNGVGSFYFSAADNASAPAWGGAAQINIYGGPSYYSPAQTFTYALAPDDYSSSSNSTTNRLELYNFVLLLADRLAALYSSSGVVLKTSSDSGVVLSSYGELYFRGAIPGIQSLCPSLFFIQVYVPTKMSVQPYDMSLGATYGLRLVGTDLEDGFNNLGNAIGVSGEVAAALIMIVITFALIIFCIKKQWGIEIGMAGGVIISLFFALIIGKTIFALIMVGSLLGVIGLVWLFILRRA